MEPHNPSDSVTSGGAANIQSPAMSFCAATLVCEMPCGQTSSSSKEPRVADVNSSGPHELQQVFARFCSQHFHGCTLQ
jgi:hypothetical protein